MRRTTFLVVILLTAIVGRPSCAQITISSDAHYSSGDYVFADETEVFGWTNSLAVREGRFSIGASIPFLVQSNPWITYTGAGVAPSGGPLYGRVVRGHRGGTQGRREPIALPDTLSSQTSGFGDPQISGSFAVIPFRSSGISVQITGIVKPPLADVDAGFSTGAWDGGIGVTVAPAFTPWFILVNGTYWWLGDLDTIPLKNGIAYSLSVGQTLFEGTWGVLTSLSGSSTVIEGIDPPLSLSGGLSFSRGPWQISSTVSSGLSEGTADWSVGAGASVTLAP